MAAAAPGPSPPPGPSSRAARLRSPAAVGLVAALVGGAVRAWMAHGAAPLVWNDSGEYLASSASPLWSVQRLAGPRPVLMPLLLSAAGGDGGAFVDWQIVAASVAWGLLAGAAAAQVRSLRGRWAAGAAVVGLSLVWPVTMWDQQILSEATALGALAVFAAAGLWLWARPGVWSAAAAVVAAALWLAARDSHLVPVAAIGAAMVLAAVWLRGPRRRPVAVAGAYLVALAFLTFAAASHGHRGDRPLEHVYAVRVLPYPDRVAWFERQGMPDAAALEAIEEAVDVERGLAPFTPVPPDPEWDRWRAWLASDGRAALVRYVAAHPAYLWEEPSTEPERVFNDLGGIEGYRPAGLRTIPGLAVVAYPPTWVAVAVAVAATLAVAVRRTRLGALFWVGAALVASAAPHALVVWHGDGMEASRHLLTTAVQLRLGTLLLVLAAASGERRPRGTDPSPPARSLDRPPARPSRGC